MGCNIVKVYKDHGISGGVRKIAERFGVDPGTVQRVSRPFEGVSAANMAA